MDGVDYRMIAIRACMQRQIRPLRLVLDCAGHCGAQITATTQSVSEGEARLNILSRAIKKGWGIDRVGYVACPTCIKRLEAP